MLIKEQSRIQFETVLLKDTVSRSDGVLNKRELHIYIYFTPA